MNYDNFNYSNENYMIFRTISTYNRTVSGQNWKSKPDEVEQEIITPENYTNYVSSISFFNNWGDGASCRAACSYTMPGYLPTTITTISPYKTTKKVACFFFIPFDILTINAGFREKEIIKNAKRFDIQYNNGRKMIYFYTDFTGVTANGIFDTRSNTWRG